MNMSKCIVTLLCLLSSFVAVKAEKEVSSEDVERFNTAIRLCDENRLKESLAIFESLSKTYPDNYVIAYETMLVEYKLHDFDKVISKGKKLIKHKEANALVYQILGNAIDISEDPNKAIKIYKEGIERFPEAGNLYLETGNVYMNNGMNEEALKWYNNGIKAAPDFPSNYYRAADQYFNSDYPIWGLIYAESEILLSPNNSARFRDMSESISLCLRDHITVTPDSISVRLAKSRDMIANKTDSNNPLLALQIIPAFPGIYEGCIGRALSQMKFEGDTIDMSRISSLATMRRYALEAYYDICHNLYGNAMYLLEYQKKVVDAGHWEAYNHYLFGYVNLAETKQWIEDNPGKLNAFIDWYNDGNQFTLSDTISVCAISIYDHLSPLPFDKAFKMQADLIVPYGTEIKE